MTDRERLGSLLRDLVPVARCWLEASPPLEDIIADSGVVDAAFSAAKSGVSNILYRYIGHIPANPNNEIDTRLLQHSYVYSKGQRGQPAVNESRESVERFLSRLMGAASLERLRATPRGNQAGSTLKDVEVDARVRDRFTVLKGPRGCGKTFFLNHVLSKYTDTLNESRIVWIRLNLPISRGFDDDLEHWIGAQITKILVRYYDLKSAFNGSDSTRPLLELVDHLHAWALENLDNEAIPTPDMIQRVEDVLLSPAGTDADISPDLVPHALCSEVRRFALNQGLGFIIVFDGFDRLDYDADSSERFNKIQRGLERLATGTANSNAAYLCVTRTNTFKALTATNPFIRSRDEDSLDISPPPIEDIVTRRLSGLLEWAGSKSSTTGTDNLAKEIENFKAHLDLVPTDKDEWGYSDLDSALGSNARAKTQLMQLRLLDYLAQSGGGPRYKYRLVEHLTCCGRRFPPMIYSYPRDENGIRAKIIAATNYDTRFLPVVFRPPVPCDRQNQVEWSFYRPLSLLHVVRCLQLLQFDSMLRQRGKLPAPLSIGDVCDVLANWFGYHRDITRIAILELEAFELCNVERRAFGSETNDAHSVRLLMKGDKFLRDMIFDPAYLNLSAMRTLLPRPALESGLFVAAAPPRSNNSTDGATTVRRWIHTKVGNTMGMIALVIAANDQQRRDFAEVGKPSGDEVSSILWNANCHIDMFRKVESWMAKALDELERIVDSARVSKFLDETEIEEMFTTIQRVALGKGGQ